MVLVEYVPTFAMGLNFPRTHCYNNHQYTAAVAALPMAVTLLLLGEGIIGKVKKRNMTDRERPTVDGTKSEMIFI